MSDIVIRTEDLSKFYRLGVIGGGTLREDLNRWWASMRGKPDPLSPVDARDSEHHNSGQIWALRDINLTVKRGEILGIIGQNGAGKSTLLKILSRITAPTSGRVEIHGRVGSLLEVGTGFHPELTGRENVFLNGAILGMSRAEIGQEFDEIVSFAEVEEFIDTPVKRYSSGMTVRLAFAVAAHLKPENLIVDEVLAVGDAAFQKKCLGKMGEVASSGRTILFVSHNMESIQRLCDRCALIDNGQLRLTGSTEEVVSKYLAENAPQVDAHATRIDKHTRLNTDQARITAVALYAYEQKTGQKKSCATFKVWQPFAVRFDIEKIEKTASFADDQSLAVWFCFVNSSGVHVESFFQYDTKPFETISIDTLSTSVEAHLDTINLSPGVYTISCGLFEFDELGKRVLIDWAENVIAFEVTAQFQDGRVFDSRVGYTISRCAWSVAK